MVSSHLFSSMFVPLSFSAATYKENFSLLQFYDVRLQKTFLIVKKTIYNTDRLWMLKIENWWQFRLFNNELVKRTLLDSAIMDRKSYVFCIVSRHVGAIIVKTTMRQTVLVLARNSLPKVPNYNINISVLLDLQLFC